MKLLDWLVLAAAVAAHPAAAQPSPAAPTEAQGPAAITLPQELPPLPPPIATFRELLGMNAQERQRALQQMPESRQRLLSAKLQEYDALTPEQREARLRMTQLHAWLVPLMTTPPAARDPKLASVPEAERRLVADRLALWDRLPPDVQRDVLTNEPVLFYFARLEASTAAQNAALLQSLPQAERQRLEEAIAKWQSISLARRQELYQHFQQFFSALTSEKEKALSVLPPAERARLEAAMKAFEHLPPPERQQCLDSLRQFLALSSDERAQFLRNAERWRAMSPAQRQAWRRLATRLPPLPPPYPPPGKPAAGAGRDVVLVAPGGGQ
jgi:hypothetical protein